MLLGIDQAIRSTGLTLMDMQGNVVAQQVLYIPTKQKILNDIDIVFTIAAAISKFIKDNPIVFFCIELPAYSSSSSRSKQLSMLFGAILATLDMPYVIGEAKTLKKFATGKGNADKIDMLKAWKNKDSQSYFKCCKQVEDKFRLKSEKTRAMEDLADSFWLAHYGRENVMRLVPEVHKVLDLEDVRNMVATALKKSNPEVQFNDIEFNVEELSVNVRGQVKLGSLNRSGFSEEEEFYDS